ncbi:MAG: metallophosphoesterase N-terminal domain-containing protein, partial [Longimicrobiales bacterium]|nr:metallophosphoesterase N-terminal domain-containing protein [Longimicrobiales bacterium]
MKRLGVTELRPVAIALLGLWLATPELRAQCGAVSSEWATGIVFDDMDRNGARGPGEPLVSGVVVSNGCDAVPTDAEGRYEIELAPGQILFISQPSGYTVPVDPHNLPLFYYTHQPNGTPTSVDGSEVD